jgi:hypothetical protein
VVSGTGFPPGSQLNVDLFSTGVLVGKTTANSLGDYQVTVTIPANTIPGTHTLVVSTSTSTLQVQTTVIVTAATTTTTVGGALSFTGANLRGPGILALLLVLAGVISVAVTWRRRPADWPIRRRR